MEIREAQYSHIYRFEYSNGRNWTHTLDRLIVKRAFRIHQPHQCTGSIRSITDPRVQSIAGVKNQIVETSGFALVLVQKL